MKKYFFIFLVLMLWGCGNEKLKPLEQENYASQDELLKRVPVLSDNREFSNIEQSNVSSFYAVQVFASSERSIAEARKALLETFYSEYDAYIKKEEDLYKVRLGKFMSKKEAEEIRQELINQNFRDAFIILEKNEKE